MVHFGHSPVPGPVNSGLMGRYVCPHDTSCAVTVLDGGGVVFREGKEGFAYSLTEVRACRSGVILEEETEVKIAQSRLRRTCHARICTLYLTHFPYAGLSFYSTPTLDNLLSGGACD